MIKYFFIFIVIFFSMDCGGSKPKSCRFHYNPEKTTLKWTAYKFTRKAGVSGVFKSFQVQDVQAADSIEVALAGMSFSIDTKSIDSNKPERDAKIIQYFFGKMAMADKISGKILSIQKGKASLELLMNGNRKTIPAVYQIDNQKQMSVEMDLNLKDWQAEEALSELNQQCKELHTGKDGKSILWPDVHVEIQSEFRMDCK